MKLLTTYSFSFKPNKQLDWRSLTSLITSKITGSASAMLQNTADILEAI